MGSMMGIAKSRSGTAAAGRGLVPWLAAAIAVAALPLPAHASETAAGPFTYITEKPTVNPNAFSEGLAQCPHGSRLTGGGGAVKPRGTKRNIASLYPDDDSDVGFEADDDYVTQVVNLAQQQASYRVTAVCIRKDLDQLFYPQDSSTSSTPGFIGSGVDVPCGGAIQRVVGGGGDVEILGFGVELLYLSRPADTDDDTKIDGWGMYALREIEGMSAKYVAYAACMYKDARKARYRSEKAVVKPGETATVTARCPSRFHASGGGGQALFMRLTSSEPRDGADADKAPDDAWRVRAVNGDSGKGHVYADVICLR